MKNGHNFNFLIQVVFATPVSIAANPKINEWLTLTEKEMRVTLAKLLQEAVKDIAVFKSGQINPNLYLQWIDKFQVSEDFSFEYSFNHTYLQDTELKKIVVLYSEYTQPELFITAFP